MRFNLKDGDENSPILGMIGRSLQKVEEESLERKTRIKARKSIRAYKDKIRDKKAQKKETPKQYKTRVKAEVKANLLKDLERARGLNALKKKKTPENPILFIQQPKQTKEVVHEITYTVIPPVHEPFIRSTVVDTTLTLKDIKYLKKLDDFNSKLVHCNRAERKAAISHFQKITGRKYHP
jgi:hypothetical protein